MTLTDIRAEEHDELVLTSDQQLAAYLNGVSVETARGELTAGMTPTEQRMLARQRAA